MVLLVEQNVSPPEFRGLPETQSARPQHVHQRPVLTRRIGERVQLRQCQEALLDRPHRWQLDAISRVENQPVIRHRHREHLPQHTDRLMHRRRSVARTQIRHLLPHQLTGDVAERDIRMTGNERIQHHLIRRPCRRLQVVFRPQPIPRVLAELHPARGRRHVGTAPLIETLVRT